MLTNAYMKLLEALPRTTECRKKWAAAEWMHSVREQVSWEVPPGARVLELGCGTGELASMLIADGATVAGLEPDISAAALARARIRSEKLHADFILNHVHVETMDRYPSHRYDAVVSTLFFHEMTGDERRYALEHAKRILRPDGVLVIADAVYPRAWFRRLLVVLHWLPRAASGYLVPRARVWPLRDLKREIEAVGFLPEKEVRSRGDRFALVVAHAPEEEKTSCDPVGRGMEVALDGGMEVGPAVREMEVDPALEKEKQT